MSQVVTHALALALGVLVGWAIFSVAARNGTGRHASGPGAATTPQGDVVWQETDRLMSRYFVGTGVLTAVAAFVLWLSRVLGPADAPGDAGALAAGAGHALAAALLFSLGWWSARGAEPSGSVPVPPAGVR